MPDVSEGQPGINAPPSTAPPESDADTTTPSEASTLAVSTGPTTGESGAPQSPTRVRALNRAVARVARAVLAAPALMFNPVTGKELRVTSRRKRTYFLRAGYLALLVIVMFWTWYATSFSPRAGLNPGSLDVSRLQEQEQASQSLSVALGWMQFLVLTLIAPVLTSSSVSDEVEDQSLDALLTTPLSAARIVGGKLTSRLANILIFILLGAPFLLAMRTSGGFATYQLIRIEILCITTALLGCSLGLLMSCWERRSWRAVVLSYFWLVVWWGLLALVISSASALAESIWPGLLGLTSSDPFLAAVQVISRMNPFVVLAWITSEVMGDTVPVNLSASWLMCNVVNVVASIVLVSISILLVHRLGRVGIAPGATIRRRRRWWSLR